MKNLDADYGYYDVARYLARHALMMSGMSRAAAKQTLIDAWFAQGQDENTWHHFADAIAYVPLFSNTVA